MTRLGTPHTALVLWDSRFSVDNLAPVGVGTLDSSYSEQGARPGPAVPLGLADVYAVRALLTPLVVAVTASGMSSVANVTVSEVGGTVLGYQGQNHPVRYENLHDASGGLRASRIGAAARLDDGYPVVAYGSSTLTLRVRRFAPFGATLGWASPVVLGADASEGAAIVALPGRLVAWGYGGAVSSAWASVDGGSTWAAWGEAPIAEQPKTLRRITAAYGGGGIVMVCQPNDTSGDLYQLVSSDLGTTFQTVAEHTALGRFVSAFPLANGDVGIVYMRSSDGVVILRRLGAAAQDLTQGEEIEIQSTVSLDALTAYCDIDGRIYVHLMDSGIYAVRVSSDYGNTWGLPGSGGFTHDAAVHCDNMVGVSTPFGGLVLHNSGAPVASAYDDSLHALWCGEWASHGFPSTANVNGSLWVPWALPEGGSWSATVIGTAVRSDGLVLTGQVAYIDSGVATDPSLIFDMQVTSGGDLATSEIAVQVRTAKSDVVLRFTTTGFRVRDLQGASTVGTVGVSLTTRLQVYVGIVNATGAMVIRYRRPGDLVWTTAFSVTLNTTGTLTPFILWGNLGGTGANVSRWYWFTHDGDTQAALTNQGRNLPSWVPPTVWGAGCSLAMAAGPATAGQTATLLPDYAYPVGAAVPNGSPSPDVRWRSLDDADQHLVFDLGGDTVVDAGAVVAVVAQAVEGKRVRLQRYNGAAWVTVETMDLSTGFQGVSYTLDGDTLTLDPGGTPGGRYVQAGEFVGGYVEFQDDGIARRIVANSAGWWSDTSEHLPVFRIELQGGEVTPGSCTIVAPGGVMLWDPGVWRTSRYWRLTLLSDVTPSGYLGAGLLLVGGVLGLGAVPDWTWTEDATPAVAVTRSPYGTPRAREVGPTRRRWSVSWGAGINLSDIREAYEEGYYSLGSGAPVAGADDVWFQLLEAFRTHAAKPVVLIKGRLPASGVTLTDRTRWLYGLLSGSVAIRGMMGEEGQDELIRVEALTVEETR